MSDNLSLMLPESATVPLGNYTIIFFPFGTASNQMVWYGTNNLQVTSWAPYDPSGSVANVTIRGDGAIVVFLLPQNPTPVPEFPQGAMAVIVLVVLPLPVFLLRRRRRT